MTTPVVTPDRLAVAEAAGKRGRDQGTDGASDNGEFDGLLALLSSDDAAGQQPVVVGEGEATARAPLLQWQDRLESAVALIQSGPGKEQNISPSLQDGPRPIRAATGEVSTALTPDKALDLLASLNVSETESGGENATGTPSPETQNDGQTVSDAITAMLLIAGAEKQITQSPDVKLLSPMAPSTGPRVGGTVSAPVTESTMQPPTGDADGADIVQMPFVETEDAFASMPGDAEPGSTAGIAEAKFTVLRTETHLAPALQQLPIVQVAERISEALSTAGDIELLRSDPASTGTKLVHDGPTKVLLIQLQPAELGTVTARMSLKNDALEVRLEVARHETAERIRQDREVLSRILQSAGYLVDNVTVHVVDADKSMTSLQLNTSQGANGTSQMPGQAQAGWSHTDGRSSGGGRDGSPGQGHSQHPAARDGMAETAQSSRSTGGGLYL